ncbi:MAG TPA: hypothetical protein VFX50_17110, partial [Gemmatimonadales bacterium]|nr:hypothetical protein [Gemmatimonadales bacterium]
MRGFWFPIGLRALAIFVLGLGLIAGGRYVFAEARDHATHAAVEHAIRASDNAMQASQNALGAHAVAAASHQQAMAAADRARAIARVARLPGMQGLTRLATTAAAKLGDQPFVLDGRSVGSIQRVQINRARQDTPLEFRLTVKLAPGETVACDVTPAGKDRMDIDHGFACASGGDLAAVGAVRFEPAGVTRALKVPQAKLKDLATGDPVDVDAQLDGPTRIDVRENGQSKVRIVSSDDGASLVVHDDDGSTIRISAGDNGVAVTVDSS